MSKLGNYEVHKSDHDFNPDILNAIALARLTKNPRDYIDCMYGGKDLRDLRNDKDARRNSERKINLDNQREDREL